MQSSNNLPLHARTHWRRIKEIITSIGKYEHLNLGSYKLNSITCYTTCGDSLEGSTVTYNNEDNDSPWVSDNYYDVFEVPAKSNSGKYSFCGEFIFLAHNTSFDYWLFGTLTDKIDYSATKSKNSLVERVHYYTYGEYSISAAQDFKDTVINKTNSGKKVIYGSHKVLNSMFDSFSERKKAFCKKTNSQILSEILGKGSNNNHNLVDKIQVKKYNKNQKKRK